MYARLSGDDGRPAGHQPCRPPDHRFLRRLERRHRARADGDVDGLLPRAVPQRHPRRQVRRTAHHSGRGRRDGDRERASRVRTAVPAVRALRGGARVRRWPPLQRRHVAADPDLRRDRRRDRRSQQRRPHRGTRRAAGGRLDRRPLRLAGRDRGRRRRGRPDLPPVRPRGPADRAPAPRPADGRTVRTRAAGGTARAAEDRLHGRAGRAGGVSSGRPSPRSCRPFSSHIAASRRRRRASSSAATSSSRGSRGSG